MSYQQLPLIYEGQAVTKDFKIGPGQGIPAPKEIPPLDYIGFVADTMDWPWPTFRSAFDA